MNDDGGKDNSMPEALKWSMTFINRIGFPIFAFCLVAWMYFFSIKVLILTIQKLTLVLVAIGIKLGVPPDLMRSLGS